MEIQSGHEGDDMVQGGLYNLLQLGGYRGYAALRGISLLDRCEGFHCGPPIRRCGDGNGFPRDHPHGFQELSPR